MGKIQPDQQMVLAKLSTQNFCSAGEQNLDQCLWLCTKISLKWTKDINLKPETIRGRHLGCSSKYQGGQELSKQNLRITGSSL